MINQYLEKIADFNQLSRAANRISGAPKAPGKPQFWQKDTLANQRAKPLSQGASQLKDNLAATGESLQSRLSANAAKVAAKPVEKGLASNILGRIGGFVKKNPIAAAAGGLAAGGLLAHKAFSSPAQPQQQYGY
jgi:hypothetical protein